MSSSDRGRLSIGLMHPFPALNVAAECLRTVRDRVDGEATAVGRSRIDFENALSSAIRRDATRGFYIGRLTYSAMAARQRKEGGKEDGS